MKEGQIILLVPLMLLFSICCCTSSSPTNDLHDALQDSYGQFLAAVESEDEERIKSTMSSNAYAENKNYYANMKAPFTSEMKKIVKFMPKLSKMNFVKVAHEGPTAAIIYMKDTEDQYQSGPSIKFILIKFVNAGEGWKYDGIYAETTSKYNADGSAKQLSLSSLPLEYAIDGKIHPSPPLLPEAEVVGFLNIVSLGYKVEVVVNNRIQAIVNNTTLNAYVKGGLKFGDNFLEIKCEKTVSKKGNLKMGETISTEEKTKFEEIYEKLNLTITAKLEGTDKEVFKYEPGLKIEGTHTYNFEVF